MRAGARIDGGWGKALCLAGHLALASPLLKVAAGEALCKACTSELGRRLGLGTAAACVDSMETSPCAADPAPGRAERAGGRCTRAAPVRREPACAGRRSACAACHYRPREGSRSGRGRTPSWSACPSARQRARHPAALPAQGRLCAGPQAAGHSRGRARLQRRVAVRRDHARKVRRPCARSGAGGNAL